MKVIFRVASIALVLFSILFISNTVGAPVVHAEIGEAKPVAVIKSNLPTSGNADIDRFILDAATRNGVDPKLVYYVIRQESNFKLSARSGKNAQGLMQMIPDTAKRFGVEDPYDPQQNIEGGVKYLRWLLKEFKGDVMLALAGYNAGEGAVKKCNNHVPDYKETQNYVQKITAAYGKTHHPVLAPEQAQEEFGAVAAE
jgi:soluble lytic murein transglycosylase-like protein